MNYQGLMDMLATKLSDEELQQVELFIDSAEATAYHGGYADGVAAGMLEAE